MSSKQAQSLASDDFSRSLATLVAEAPDYRRVIRDSIAGYSQIAFYGCGNIFHTIARTWREHISRPIDLACDSNPEKWGKTFEGILCVSPEELARQKDQTAVFVTVGECFPVIDSLVQAGFPSVNVIFMYDLIAADYLDKNSRGMVTDQLLAAYRLFEDERSKEVFRAIVRRVLRADDSPHAMADVRDPDQYFPADVVRLRDDEHFVDVGAFDGDTVRDFLSRTHSQFGKIHALELNQDNFQLLQKFGRQQPSADRIHLLNRGAWDEEKTVHFSIGKSQSTIGDGEGTGTVAPLDDILRGERVTFLKMDIEGAEPQALRGAASLIREQKPTLAICVYHHFSHLWEIPLFIKELVPEYQLYLRHHTNLEYETVCYAQIPPKTSQP